ncbi:MAG: MFS transporter [Spirochaetaceae bacterium]
MKEFNTVSKKNWIVMTLLGLSGFIAWNVENSWFNTFVYDTITPNPEPIAIMVAVSAIVATITTLLMGTLSDRIGRRKPFIFLGYILWALSTIAFPMSSWTKSVQLAIILVIALDAVMTFFGSTANDAAFNAWVTDITHKGNRGKVEALLNILPVFAVIIGMGLSGLIIDKFGYFPFFLSLGSMVLIMGTTGSLLLKDSPNLKKSAVGTDKNYFKELIQIFTIKSIKNNTSLYLVFLTITIYSISTQIIAPYEMIYINNYLEISKSIAGILTALVAPVLILFALPIGILTDKGKGFPVVVVGFIIASLGQFLFSTTDNLILLGVFGALKNVGFLMFIVLGAWSRNLMPADARGQFQGVRLIFMVMLPMIIGPAIGAKLITILGIPSVINGLEGFIPTPVIYQVSALVGLLPLIPLFILKRKDAKL